MPPPADGETLPDTSPNDRENTTPPEPVDFNFSDDWQSYVPFNNEDKDLKDFKDFVLYA